MEKIKKHSRRIAIDVAGVGCMIIGLLLSPFPGPWSIPMYILGLGLLAQNYTWAQRLLEYIKKHGENLVPTKYKKYTRHIVIGITLISITAAAIFYIFFKR